MKFELNMVQRYALCFIWRSFEEKKLFTHNCLLIVYKFISISFSVLITRMKKPNSL